MRLFLFVLLMSTSLSSFARQYTQCSDVEKDLYAVINLPSYEKGTLFLTLGAETDVRFLYDIEVKKYIANKGYYQFTTASGTTGLLVIPSHLLGLNSDSVNIEIHEDGIVHLMSCFTRVYND